MMMEGDPMTRLILFACLTFAAILLFQSDHSITGYQSQMRTRLAQDDSGSAQTPDPSTNSDTDSSDDSGKPDQDQD
jgi:hypothetical protein